jgi:hypothetical protein
VIGTYGLASCPSKGLTSDSISILASTKYLHFDEKEDFKSTFNFIFAKGVQKRHIWFLVNHDHTPNKTSFAIAIASTCPHMNACMEVWKEKLFEGN